MQTVGFSGVELDLTDLAQALLLGGSEQQVGFDTNSKMPPPDLEPGHELGVAKSSIYQQADLTYPEDIEHPLDFGQDRKQLGGTDLGAGVLQNSGDERHRSSPEQHRDTDQARPLEQHSGVECPHQGVLAPVAWSVSHERIVDAARVDG